jgi:hypothetical protein
MAKSVALEGEPNLHDYDFVVVNTSGGKDSSASMATLFELAARVGFPIERIVCVHADLGRVEWKGVPELATEHAAMFGRPLAVVALGTVFTMFFGTLMRLGALQVGLHVPRLRLERLVRNVGLIIGLIGIAVGRPGAVMATSLLIAGWGIWEIVRIGRRVWHHAATEFAWSVRAGDEFRGDILTALPPGESEDGADWELKPIGVH